MRKSNVGFGVSGPGMNSRCRFLCVCVCVLVCVLFILWFICFGLFFSLVLQFVFSVLLSLHYTFGVIRMECIALIFILVLLFRNYSLLQLYEK